MTDAMHVKSTSMLEAMQLLARVSDLRMKSSMSLLLALSSVVYMAINVACLVLNGYDLELPDAVISVSDFHRLEFWATFGFIVVQVIALMYMPKQFGELSASPSFLKLVVLVNVCLSFMAALLVTISVEDFEVPSHELEYTNELTMAFVDLTLFGSLLRNADGKLWHRSNINSVASVLMVLLAVSVATAQLGIYNLMGWTDDGDSKGETLAHYFEFVFEAISAAITFWFTMDNRFVAEAQIESLLGMREDAAPERESSEAVARKRTSLSSRTKERNQEEDVVLSSPCAAV
jgi:hypothetical protein